MYILAQVFMTLNIFFFISCFFTKNKTLLFLLQTISSLFFTLQYLCLGAWPGFYSALAELIRVTLFFFFVKYNVKQRFQILTCVIAFIATLVLTIIYWDAWYSILPLLGMIGIYVTLFSKRIYIVKLGLTITVTCSTIYLLLLHSYYSAVLEIINLIIGVVILIKEITAAHKQKVTTNN